MQPEIIITGVDFYIYLTRNWHNQAVFRLYKLINLVNYNISASIFKTNSRETPIYCLTLGENSISFTP